MRRAAVVATGALLGAGGVLCACSLLTSLDGLTDGASVTADGGRDTSVAIDGTTSDGPTMSDAGDAGEAGPSPSALYAAAVLSDKPLGYWRLEETSGNVAADETGSQAGSYLSNPQLGATGVAGSRAMKLLKATNARMLVASAAYRFPNLTPYTVELWAKPGEFKDYQWFGGTERFVGPSRTGWSVLIGADGLVRYEVWRPNDGGSDQVRGVFITPVALSTTAFTHVVIAYTGSEVIGYVNGIKTTTFTTSGICPDTGELVWGCRGDVAHCSDDWTYDELAVYDTVLAAARVKAHYDLGK